MLADRHLNFRNLGRIHSYSVWLYDRIFPIQTVEIESFKFRSLRTDAPPHNPKTFAPGIEFHKRVRNLSGQIAFDIGANIGSYTLPLSRRFRLVVAFEPNKTDCTLLRQNVGINRVRNVRIYQIALSDNTGNRPLYVRSGGATSLEAHHYGLRHRRVQLVKTARLDDFLSTVDHLDFVKIDAEGHESSILRGGTKLITFHNPSLAVEVHQACLPSAGSCMCDVCESLKNLGYAVEILGQAKSVGDVHWVWGTPTLPI